MRGQLEQTPSRFEQFDPILRALFERSETFTWTQHRVGLFELAAVSERTRHGVHLSYWLADAIDPE